MVAGKSSVERSQVEKKQGRQDRRVVVFVGREGKEAPRFAGMIRSTFNSLRFLCARVPRAYRHMPVGEESGTQTDQEGNHREQAPNNTRFKTEICLWGLQTLPRPSCSGFHAAQRRRCCALLLAVGRKR